ncbi:MAG: amidohydrolase [Acidobacteria bacterium]|nr:amidohydrolase [Acidobacteriota bacterium]
MSLATPGGAVPSEQADLIFLNGHVITLDQNNPRAEAVAIRGDRILAVTDHQKIQAYRGPATRVVDLGGKTVIPGLIDAHGHMSGLGESLRRLNFVGTTSFEHIVRQVAVEARRRPKGEWVLGRGWDQNDWEGMRLPTHGPLTEMAPDHPVYLTRIDGHAGLVNRKAMELAGVSRLTPDPPGGRIVRDSYGEPTGVLVDNAQALVLQKIPPPTLEHTKEGLRVAIAECLKYGLTSVHDAGVGEQVLQAYRELLKEGQLNLRVYAMLRGDDAFLDSYFQKGPEVGAGGHRLTIRSVKMTFDGALGSRGAALLEPYSDDPGNRGLILIAPERIASVLERALRSGFQVGIHAIGDRANRLVLDLFEKAQDAFRGKDLRWRIEHAQVVSPQDIPRFARLGVIPSMQATHATSDMYWARDRLGSKRLEGAYAWRSFLETGSRIANGSDFPVEHVSPLMGFYAAITRQDAKGWPPEGWLPEHCMTREEALRSFTLDAAYAAFEEGLKGSLEAGKLADLVVLSENVLEIPPSEILQTEVLMTVLGGKIAYQR